jgi:tRNA pseudouridine38-40 synthase
MVVHALKISYLGSAYQGWQLQPGLPTIQGELERALEAELGTSLRVTGASRTDAGVHARGQVATIRLGCEVAIGRLVHGVNRRLPEDIRVLESWIAAPDFHPRFDACWKEYHYSVEHRAVLSPLDADRVLAVPEGVPLDLERLERATAALVGEHDFAAFALVGGAHTTSRRRLDEARWVVDGTRLTLVLRGNGFLRGMVRSIVGTLLEVARGRRSVENFAGLLAGADRSAAGRTAPPHGLCLVEVGYGEGGRT